VKILKKITSILIACIVIWGIYVPQQTSAAENDASYCEPFRGQTKVWWDGVQLKPGQIGRLSIEKDTPLFKLDGDKRTFSRTLKKGENYRIYSFRPGLLSVGAGYFVDRDEKIKYQTPSKTKLKAAYCVYYYLPAHISYALNPNKIYEYQDEYGYNLKETWTLDHKRDDGVNFWRRDFDFGYSRIEKETNEGLFEYGAADVNGNTVLPSLLYPIKKGKKWGLGEGENLYGYREIISTNSTVKTKSGTFKNVVVVKEYYILDYMEGVHFQFYAPNVGIIKEVEGK
jgi:hypothetical protein